MNETLELEPELVRRAKSGDRTAFSSLYDQYFDRIFDFCYQMSRNRDDAADLVSEVFLKAMERLPSLKDDAAFKGWLYTIARNATLNLVERRGRTTAMPDDYEPVPPPGAAVAPDPSDVVSDRELTTLVWDAAATLNPRDYSIFEMTVRQGLDSAEVADALGVKKSHAYVLVSRLKDTVEEALSAVVLAKAGRRDCSTLDAIVAEFAGELSPRLRKAVGGHMKRCEDCQRSRKRYASAAMLLGGVASAAPMSGLKEEIARDLELLWPARGPGAGNGRTRRGRKVAAAASIPAALVLFALLAFGQDAGPDALGRRFPWPVPVRDVMATPSPSPATPSPIPTPAPSEDPAAILGPDETAGPRTISRPPGAATTPRPRVTPRPATPKPQLTPPPRVTPQPVPTYKPPQYTLPPRRTFPPPRQQEPPR